MGKDSGNSLRIMIKKKETPNCLYVANFIPHKLLDQLSPSLNIYSQGINLRRSGLRGVPGEASDRTSLDPDKT